jgi:hypothetical protein
MAPAHRRGRLVLKLLRVHLLVELWWHDRAVPCIFEMLKGARVVLVVL